MTIPIPGWFRRRSDSVAAELAELRIEIRLVLLATERLIKMSETNQATIDNANANMQATLDSIQADVTAITAELQANVPTPGAVPSQASIDALTANVARLQLVKAALDGLVIPAPVG